MLFIRRAFYSNTWAVQHMGINHRGSHIAMSKQFLCRADVVSAFKEMSGKGVTEHMTAHLFVQSCLFRGFFHRVLQDAFMQMMTPYFSGPGVGRKPLRGKHILPAPFSTLREVGFSTAQVDQLADTFGMAHFPCSKGEFVEFFDWFLNSSTLFEEALHKCFKTTLSSQIEEAEEEE